MLGVFSRWGHGRYSGLLSLYLDGQLEAHQLEKLERHLATCASCQAELETLKSTVGLLRALPRTFPRRSFTLVEAPSTPQGTPAYLWGMRLATSIAALALVFMIVGDFLGTFSRDVAPVSEPTTQAAEEELSVEAAGDTQRTLTLDAASPAPDTDQPALAPTPQADAEEKLLPVATLEVVLGGLLGVLVILTLAATRRFQRDRATG